MSPIAKYLKSRTDKISQSLTLCAEMALNIETIESTETLLETIDLCSWLLRMLQSDWKRELQTALAYDIDPHEICEMTQGGLIKSFR